MDKIYDLIIIGSGPAGLSAAIYGVRAKLDLLVIEKEMIKRTGRKAEMIAHIGAVVSANIGADIVAILIRRKNK